MTEIIKCEVMTSREIAELTGKQHNDVLKAINKQKQDIFYIEKKYNELTKR